MVSTTNLVAYYKFDDDVLDAHGSYDGTATGASYAAAVINNGFTGSYVTITDTADFDFTGAFSVSLWFKTSATNDAYLYAKNGEWALFMDGPGGSVKFNINVGGTQITSGTGFNDGSYHHLVLTRDGSGNCTMYIDGSSEGTATNSSDLSSATDTEIGAIGGALGGRSDFDEVGVWKGEELSSTDVTDLYNSGSGLAYPFGSGTTVNVSTLTATTTGLSPSYFIDITQGPISAVATAIGPIIITPTPKTIYPEALTATATVLTPNIIVPLIVYPSTLAASATLMSVKLDDGSGDIFGGKGTRIIAREWPVEKGLIAKTTSQTGNTINLVPRKSKVSRRKEIGL